jgi:hypothetical protein
VIDCNLLRELESSRAEELCRMFLPNGKKVGSEWKVGDVSGAPGCSLGVQLTGPKAGLWLDRATGEGGSFSKLVSLKLNLPFPQTVEAIEGALGVCLRSGRRSLTGTNNYTGPINNGLQEPRWEILGLDGLVPCSLDQLKIISSIRSIRIEGLRLALERRVLFSYCHPYQGQCWVITDDSRRNAIRRRLDGHCFDSVDGKKPKSMVFKGAQANWPIGIARASSFPAIPLCEGGPDFLAAFDLAYAGGVEQLVAPVCMTGAGCSIHEETLPFFRGKRVRIFGHADEGGQAAMQRWAEQLRAVQAEVDGFDFSGLVRADGSPVKDLNDFLLADKARSNCAIEILTGAFDFALERQG